MEGAGCCGTPLDSTRFAAFVIASANSNRSVEVRVNMPPYPKKRLKIR